MKVEPHSHGPNWDQKSMKLTDAYSGLRMALECAQNFWNDWITSAVISFPMFMPRMNKSWTYILLFVHGAPRIILSELQKQKRTIELDSIQNNLMLSQLLRLYGTLFDRRFGICSGLFNATNNFSVVWTDEKMLGGIQ